MCKFLIALDTFVGFKWVKICWQIDTKEKCLDGLEISIWCSGLSSYGLESSEFIFWLYVFYTIHIKHFTSDSNSKNNNS